MKNKDANVKKVLAARQFGVIFWDRNGCQSKIQGMASGLSSSMVFAKFASISFALHAVHAKRSPNHLPPRRRRKIFRFVNVSSPN